MDDLIVGGHELLATVRKEVKKIEKAHEPHQVLLYSDDEAEPRPMAGKQLETLLEERLTLEMPTIARNNRHTMSIFEKEDHQDMVLLGQFVWYSPKVST